MEYGWNIAKDDSSSFGSLSREFYYANLLIDEILSENIREVRRLLKFHGARADVVVPERGAAALHVLAGLEGEDFAAAVILRVLRRSGADPDVRSEEGLTPTHVAATYGRCRILEVLLTNGANPSLIDYRLLLDAKDHAYKERQWQAFTMLTTYTAILENEERFYKYLDPKEELRSDPVSRSDIGLNACKHEAEKTNLAANNSNQLIHTEGNDKEVCDWLKKTLEVIPLDKSAVSIVKNHSKNIETYEFPVGKEEEHINNFDDTLSDMCGPKLGENKVLATKRYLEDKLSWLRSPKQSCKEPEVNSSKSSDDLNLLTKPSLGHQSKNGHDMESIKYAPSNPNIVGRRKSDMYVYGYAESSIKSKRSHHEAADSAVCQKYDLDHSSNNMLCKMSRIFLFILKKRHSTYHQLP